MVTGGRDSPPEFSFEIWLKSQKSLQETITAEYNERREGGRGITW
jgi:hypothetical protein